MGDVLVAFLKSNGLVKRHNAYLVSKAWDSVSGVAAYTLRKFFKDGTFQVTVSSSMVRTHLQMQSDAILSRLNAVLEQDESFIVDDNNGKYVKKLIIK